MSGKVSGFHDSPFYLASFKKDSVALKSSKLASRVEERGSEKSLDASSAPQPAPSSHESNDFKSSSHESLNTPHNIDSMAQEDFDQEDFQDTVHLKIELEAKDSLVQELRNENLKLIEELKNGRSSSIIITLHLTYF